MQRTLFNYIKRDNEMLELLRLEVRLNSKVKLDSILVKLGYAKGLKYKEIYDVDISKKVINYYWESMIANRNMGLFTIQINNKDTLRKVYQSRSDMGIKQAIYLTGLIALAKEGNGMRELRSIIASSNNTRSWYRVSKDYGEISKVLVDRNVRGWVKQVENALDEYEPINAKNYTNLNFNKPFKSEIELQIQKNMVEYTESIEDEITN